LSTQFVRVEIDRKLDSELVCRQEGCW